MHTEDIRREAEKRAEEVYRVTQSAAGTNSLVQAVSGTFGMGWNLAADVAVIPLYVSMWNDIRGIYGQGKIGMDEAIAFIKLNLPYLAADLLMDKALGTIPVVGIPINYTYAKALTWRLGAFFGLMAALDSSHEDVTIARACAEVIEKLFPMKSLNIWDTITFQYKAPDRELFIKLLSRFYRLSPAEAQQRFEQALDILFAEDDEEDDN